jgi:hypothetical protein
MTLAEQVALALQRADTTSRTPAGSPAPERYRLTPDGAAFALGWIVANAIVGAYYRAAGVDVLPSYDPERGWDRFLITRRVTCWRCAGDLADRLGSVVLAGQDAPALVRGDAGRMPLRDALRRDPEGAVRRVLDRVAPPPLPQGDHSACWHEVAQFYPALFGAVAELVLEHPGVTVAREIFVDDREIDGTFHPLYLHGVATEPRMVYDWFAVETGEHVAYVRIHGRSALYRSDSGGWSTARAPLAVEDHEDIKRLLRAWLRIAGRPDPED